MISYTLVLHYQLQGPDSSSTMTWVCFWQNKQRNSPPKHLCAEERGCLEGRVGWRGVKRLLPSMGKHWLILKNFCEKKRPAHSSLITALHNAQQRAISYRKTMRSPESEGEPDRVRKRETNEMNHLSVEEDLGPWWPLGGRTCMRGQKLLLTKQSPSPSHDRQKYVCHAVLQRCTADNNPSGIYFMCSLNTRGQRVV